MWLSALLVYVAAVAAWRGGDVRRVRWLLIPVAFFIAQLLVHRFVNKSAGDLLGVGGGLSVIVLIASGLIGKKEKDATARANPEVVGPHSP
jgi:hypothetical protein